MRVMAMCAFIAGLSFAHNGAAAQTFCLRHKTEAAAYHGCSEITPPYATSPIYLCDDPDIPNAVKRVPARDPAVWERMPVGQDWCQPVGRGLASPVRGTEEPGARESKQ